MCRWSESYSRLGEEGWQECCQDDGPRLPLDLKALPYARGSHGAPLVRAKIIEALESVGKLRQGTCVVYNNGLYDGGLFRIKPSGWGRWTYSCVFQQRLVYCSCVFDFIHAVIALHTLVLLPVNCHPAPLVMQECALGRTGRNTRASGTTVCQMA